MFQIGIQGFLAFLVSLSPEQMAWESFCHPLRLVGTGGPQIASQHQRLICRHNPMCDYVRDMWSWFLMLRELFSLSIIKCQNVPFLCFLVVTEVQTTKLFDFSWGKYLPVFPDMV